MDRAVWAAMAVLALPGHVIAAAVSLGGAPALGVVIGVDGAAVVGHAVVGERKNTTGTNFGTTHSDASCKH